MKNSICRNLDGLDDKTRSFLCFRLAVSLLHFGSSYIRNLIVSEVDRND